MTNNEKQFLLDMVKSRIRYLHEDLDYIKFEIRFKYDKCDPDDIKTQVQFVILNMYKDNARDIKKKLKKLSAISKSLKTELRRQ